MSAKQWVCQSEDPKAAECVLKFWLGLNASDLKWVTPTFYTDIEVFWTNEDSVAVVELMVPKVEPWSAKITRVIVAVSCTSEKEHHCDDTQLCPFDPKSKEMAATIWKEFVRQNRLRKILLYDKAAWKEAEPLAKSLQEKVAVGCLQLQAQPTPENILAQFTSWNRQIAEYKAAGKKKTAPEVDPRVITEWTARVLAQDSKECSIPLWIVNLAHRKDLLELVEDQIRCMRLNIKSSRFVGTADGYKEPLDGLFKGYPKAFTEQTQKRLDKGELGCWLSHVRIWEAVVKNGPLGVLVIENRAAFGLPFQRDWPALDRCISASCHSLDVVWIGYHVENHLRAELMLDTKRGSSNIVDVELHPDATVVPGKTVKMSLPNRIGGTFAYYVSPRGATRMLNALTTTQVMDPLDKWMQFRVPPPFRQLACLRPLVWHSYLSKGGDIQSHQRSFEL